MTIQVTIIGGGIGGLVLARTLHVNGIKASVYEAETSPNARSQGGMLDIHDTTGQPALKACGLYGEFLKIIHTGGQASRILDKDGKVLMEEPDDGGHARPEVPRGELRRILIESLPEGTIHWGHKVSSVEPMGGARHRVHFTNGVSIESRILIGADGAWSKIRPLVSDQKPVYTGTTFVETYLRDADDKHQLSAKVVGPGSLYVLSPGKGIVAHREPNAVLHTYVVLQRDLEWFEAVDFSENERASEYVANEFSDWSPELRSLVLDSDSGFIKRPIYALPPDHRWKRTPGVTLLGDAAHLAAPAGDGANLAMFDGAELGRFLSENRHDPEKALRDYENELFVRSAAAAKDSLDFNAMWLNEEAPRSFLAFMSGD